MVYDLSYKEDINSCFIFLCSKYVLDQIPITDDAFLKTYFSELATKELEDACKGLRSPSQKTSEFYNWMLKEATQERLLGCLYEDRLLMQEQAQKDGTTTIRNYHIESLSYIKEDIYRMKQKYDADSIGEIITHLYHKLLPVMEQHKRDRVLWKIDYLRKNAKRTK